MMEWDINININNRIISILNSPNNKLTFSLHTFLISVTVYHLQHSSNSIIFYSRIVGSIEKIVLVKSFSFITLALFTGDEMLSLKRTFYASWFLLSGLQILLKAQPPLTIGSSYSHGMFKMKWIWINFLFN